MNQTNVLINTEKYGKEVVKLSDSTLSDEEILKRYYDYKNYKGYSENLTILTKSIYRDDVEWQEYNYEIVRNLKDLPVI